LVAYIRVGIDGVATYLSGVIDLPQIKRYLKIMFERRICDKRIGWYKISRDEYFFTRPIQENGPADAMVLSQSVHSKLRNRGASLTAGACMLSSPNVSSQTIIKHQDRRVISILRIIRMF